MFVSQQHIPAIELIIPEAQKPQEWISKVEKLENPIQPPSLTDFQTKLRPYQNQGYIWLHNLYQWAPGACLADDMGLGKTIQTLAFLYN